MQLVLLAWPPGPKLPLDYRCFAYAGKFVMTNTGKAVALPDDADPEAVRAGDTDAVLGAISFNEDRTDSGTLWIRYVTVRADRRGEGIGPRLAALVADAARAKGYDRVRIAVNNPFAYEALYRAGFGYTGERTGLAELVLEWPSDRPADRYQAGLDAYREREVNEAEATFLQAREGVGPPIPLAGDSLPPG
jgi:GNAT superfamily N-acetyltransferase